MGRARHLMALLAALAVAGPLAAQQPAYEQLQAFSSLLNQVRLYYVDSVTTQQLVQGAIVGMLAALDPHSHFQSREEALRLGAWMDGRYASLGLYTEIVDGAVTVVSAYPGGPADRAGIAAGDRIVSVNDSTLEGLDPETVRARLVGPRGERVHLRLERGPRYDPDTVSVTVRRDFLHPRSVGIARTLADGTGYVQLLEFLPETGRELHDAVGRVARGRDRRLILDLRGNPGGMLQAAVEVSSLFLSANQLVFSTSGRRPSTSRDFRTEHDGDFRDMPVVVLVDQGTASAAEAVAGSLQDHDRALIIGRRTFGKALMQRFFELAPTGDAVWLTVGYVSTPSGRLIQRRYRGLRTAEYLGESGKAGQTADTLAEFHTDAGRIVRGGGGIRPDTLLAAPPEWPTWWAVAADSGYLTAVADSVGLALDAGSTTRERWMSARTEWLDRLLPPVMARVRERLGVRAAPTGPLAERMARALAARVAQVRWSADVEADFWLRNDPDVAAGVALLPQVAARLSPPGSPR